MPKSQRTASSSKATPRKPIMKRRAPRYKPPPGRAQAIKTLKEFTAYPYVDKRIKDTILQSHTSNKNAKRFKLMRYMQVNGVHPPIIKRVVNGLYGNSRATNEHIKQCLDSKKGWKKQWGYNEQMKKMVKLDDMQIDLLSSCK